MELLWLFLEFGRPHHSEAKNIMPARSSCSQTCLSSKLGPPTKCIPLADVPGLAIEESGGGQLGYFEWAFFVPFAGSSESMKFDD